MLNLSGWIWACPNLASAEKYIDCVSNKIKLSVGFKLDD